VILVPNTVIHPKSDLKVAIAGLSNEHKTGIENLIRTRAGTSPLTKLKGIFVRFEQIRVLDNHSSILGFDISADVYPIIMVVNDAATSPYEFKFIKVFNDINDLDTLPIDNGLDTARSTPDKIPRFFDIHVVLMKSNERERDISKAIHDAVNSDTGKSLQDTIEKAVTAANPVAGVIISAATSLLSLVTGILSNEKDEQIFYGVASFEDDPDNLGIGTKRLLTDKKNASIIYEILPQYS
jgi:hypothetical protein